MKRAAAAGAGVIAMTLAMLCALLWIRPFDRINSAMDGVVHAAPKWSQVENLYVDPHTQETSHGNNPRSGLDSLESYWREHRSTPKVLFIGNSQMLAMSLAPGEPPSSRAEMTYVDLLARDFQSHPPDEALIYRLAAPGMSYEEALWYLGYFLCHPALRPSAIVLQINYQAFWTGGIRESLDGLAEDSCFRSRLQEFATSRAAFADDFREAELRSSQAAAQQSRPQAEAAATPFGPALEDAFIRRLNESELFRAGLSQKDDFAQMLYRLRLYVLQVKPSSARSVTGPRLTKSQAALEQIAELCATSGVRLVLFSAPVNPAVSLYSSDRDRATYVDFVRSLVSRHGLTFFDLEHAIDGKYWGRQFNSADPLHIGRRGHEILAGDMLPVVKKAIARE